MKKPLKSAAFPAIGAIALAAAATTLITLSVEGADHGDSDAAGINPVRDIADLYAWMSDDRDHLNLILSVHPNAADSATLGTETQMVLDIASREDFGATSESHSRLICQYYDDTNLECWLLDDAGEVQEYVEGDPSDPEGLTSEGGELRVFLGVRDDPFFFNLEGFTNAVSAAVGAAGDLEFNAGSCPTIDEATSEALRDALESDTGESDREATDDLEGASVIALVAQVETDSINTAGDFLAVWGSTHVAE